MTAQHSEVERGEVKLCPIVSCQSFLNALTSWRICSLNDYGVAIYRKGELLHYLVICELPEDESLTLKIPKLRTKEIFNERWLVLA